MHLAIKTSKIESVEDVLVVYFTEVFVPLSGQEPGYPCCTKGRVSKCWRQSVLYPSLLEYSESEPVERSSTEQKQGQWLRKIQCDALHSTYCLRPAPLCMYALERQSRVQAVLAVAAAPGSRDPPENLRVSDAEALALPPQLVTAVGLLSPAAAFSARRLRHAKPVAAVV